MPPLEVRVDPMVGPVVRVFRAEPLVQAVPPPLTDPKPLVAPAPEQPPKTHRRKPVSPGPNPTLREPAART